MANVTSSTLPLSLTRPRTDQSAAGALPLPLSQEYCSSSSLPIRLSRPRSDQPAASALPLPLSRKLGSATSVTSPKPKPPKPPKRRMVGLLSCHSGALGAVSNIGICNRVTNNSQIITADRRVAWSSVDAVMACKKTRTDSLESLIHCDETTVSDSVEITRCATVHQEQTEHQSACSKSSISAVDSHSRCATIEQSATDYRNSCAPGVVSDVDDLARCYQSPLNDSVEIMRCLPIEYQPAVPVPCEYYPLPIPDPTPPDNSVCRARPAASQLPLTLKRRRQTWTDSASLALPLTCWHDQPENPIPTIRTYTMHNTITCTIDGVAVEILSAKVNADIKGFCWQGEVTIAPDDFKKINFNKPKGQEPLIDININGTQWIVALENVRENREFVNNSYTLSGRSQTAKLGADYSKTKSGLITQALYARQIADEVLKLTGYSIQAWDIVDWLVPANIYDMSNKTPLAVIAELADVAGGFVESNKTQKQLHIKPRWKRPAWEIAAGAVDKTIPGSAIVSISGQQIPSTRYNAIRLNGGSAGKLVYRLNQDKKSEGGLKTSALYTHDQPMISAGKALLSESGNHKQESVTMPWMPKYNIDLANLGDIWSVTEGATAWRGVVQGVSVSVEIEQDAPKIWQTVSIDRYTDV